MNKLLIHGLFFLFIVSNSFGQNNNQAHKWETVDVSFTTNGKTEKPFQVELSCQFKGPDGSQITVPGFYNGNNEWLVRFNPNVEGVWTSISSSTIKKLNGIKHSIEVAPAKKGIHVGITISDKNTQKLKYEDGTPYNLVANEVDWLFALDYGNPDLTKTKKLIDAISANGFNQIIMNVYAYDLDWKQSENIDPKWNFGSKKDIFPFLGDK